MTGSLSRFGYFLLAPLHQKNISNTTHIFAISLDGWELSFFGICKLSYMSIVLVVDIDGAGEAVA